MRVRAIIPVHNRRELTLACLRQLARAERGGVELHVMVVDDGSVDGTTEAIAAQFPEVDVIQGDGNLWWTGAIKRGLEATLRHDCDYVLLLNDDLELANDFLSELAKVARRHPSGLVSSIKLRRRTDGTEEILAGGFHLVGRLHEVRNSLQGNPYVRDALPSELQADMLTGASLLMPVHVIRSIGWPDQARFPHNWGDLEYTRRASVAGYACWVASRSRVYTDRNRNYHQTYLIEAGRLEYLKNLFDSRRYCYGFRSIYHMAFMHRPPHLATILFLRQSMSIARWAVLKLVLPTALLRRLADVRISMR